MIGSVRTFILALWAAAALVAAATPVLAQEEINDAPDPFVHRTAQIAFPDALDEFERGRVFEFAEDGSNAGVGYYPTALAGEVTLYVYPSGGLTCREQFEGSGEAIVNRNGKPAENDRPLSLAPFAGAGWEQLSAQYTIAAGGFGYDHPDLVSYLWIACDPESDWMVKYRGSYLASDAAKVEGLAERLFAGIDWTPLIARQ